MRPGKQSHARYAQTKTCPAPPIRRGKRKLSDETAALNANMQNQPREQKQEQPFDGTRPEALTLKSAAISPQSLARSPYAKSKSEPHQEHRNQQRPETCFEYFFGVHGECSVQVLAREAA